MRRPLNKVMEEIYVILEGNTEISIRKLSLKLNSQWFTVEKALKSLKFLKVVKERIDMKENRKTRLFSLK